MSWQIVDGPGEGPWEGRDAVGWLWTIQSEDGTQRRILVEVSGTAMAVSDGFLPEEVLAAKQSLGRSAVEGVLQDADPPKRISFSTLGRSPAELGEAGDG